MANSPNWKVYNPQGVYVASCKHPEDAACLIVLYGTEAKIKWGHNKVVWHEGHEDQFASESYDHVAAVARRRIFRL